MSGEFDPGVSQRHYDACLDLWASAEPAGFDGIFFSEHHFGSGYSPAPNLLVASIAQRTKTLRLGVMGMVAPYHTPWQLIEEVGMLDHLTGGRLDIGTSAGIPNEMEKVGLGVDEARARNDELVDILDKALADPVISHHGKFWSFDNLRLTPRCVQQPSPPKWVTVVSVSSARRAARRGARITTGFHPQSKVKEIFDAYRDEAQKAGLVVGPDHLGLRRRVSILDDDRKAGEVVAKLGAESRRRLLSDPRLATAERPAVLDTPTAHSFTIGDEEFLAGTPATLAAQIIEQCRYVGAGHFLANFDRTSTIETLKDWYRQFGKGTIPLLKSATVG